MDNKLKFAEDFKGNSLCIVCGSTWPEDEKLLLDFINHSESEVKFIIAPHKIEADKIERFQNKIVKKTILLSQVDQVDISQYSVIIIDCIGLLSKLYSYADIAYVGGAAGKTGLHNVLEPATFSLPIVIGENFQEFPEAVQLKKIQGLFSVKTTDQCDKILTRLVVDTSFRTKTGEISGDFVSKNTGATSTVLNYITSRFR